MQYNISLANILLARLLPRIIDHQLFLIYNCIRKGFFKVTILNQVITMQNYELLLCWKWPREKHFANQTSFHTSKTVTGKVYLKEAMMSLLQLLTEGKDSSLFTGGWHFVESWHHRRKWNITPQVTLTQITGFCPSYLLVVSFSLDITHCGKVTMSNLGFLGL